ncbi:FadR/GntR family transcriptional regulator [Microvirga yunnanensis]|uniref:FadR/GntR family transcriptional regulator n=1 Tax=Microvirga yunnanensis TaxID=2953740 RepID=UPI0021C8DAD8|nr:FadR/GntR family transcriptional regulator [Microvirga sp. HBU65207]
MLRDKESANEEAQIVLETLVPRPNLAAHAAGILARSIEDGLLRPGARLPGEIELARQLGVSRPVVREAIAYLKADGLVESRHGRGLFVGRQETLRLRLREIDASEKTILEFLELRRGLEVEAAQLAALRHTAHDLDRMEAAIAALNVADEAGEESSEHDLAFHLAIADAARNPLFRRVLQFVAKPLLASIQEMRAKDRGAAQRIEKRRADHDRILERIRARDADGAGEAMRRHIDEACDHYTALLPSEVADLYPLPVPQKMRSKAGKS